MNTNASQHLIQARKAEEIGTEYVRRLKEAGFVFDIHDCFHAPEGVDPELATKIWEEVTS